MKSESLMEHMESRQQHDYNENGVCITEQIRLSSHLWNVSALQFSPDGLNLASASWDKSIHLWRLKTLDSPKKYFGDGKGHSLPVTCLSWLPHIEFLLVSGSADHSVLLWDTDTGDIMARLKEHESWVLDISFLSDGKYLASSSWDGNTFIWDMDVLKPISKLSGHDAGVWSCQFNQDVTHPILCTASEDTSIRLWDMRTDHCWHSDVILSGIHNDAIKCCTWSPCGSYIAAGSKDTKISVWDVRANKVINCLHGHQSTVQEIQFMPNSSSMLFSVGDTSCCLWNAFSPQGESLVKLQQHTWSYEVEALSISPDSTLLATGGIDKTVCLSSVEISDTFISDLYLDVNNLPYAKIPAITQPTTQAKDTSAYVVDDTVTRSETKELELGAKVTKQTIRIKKHVTSEVLQSKLGNLKTTLPNESNLSFSSASFKEMSLNRQKKRASRTDSKLELKSKDVIGGDKNQSKTLPPPVKAKPVKNKIPNGFDISENGLDVSFALFSSIDSNNNYDASVKKLS